MPLKEKSVSANKAPWMNNSLKCLIRRRQKELTNNNLAVYNQLRSKVNRDRKVFWAEYYGAKVKDLKACKPAQWWKEIKQLSGFSKVERANPIADLQHLADEGEDPKHLAHVINDAFLSPMSAFTPLATSETSPSYIWPISQSSRHYRRLTRTKRPDLIESPLGYSKKTRTYWLHQWQTSWILPFWKNIPLPKTSPVSDANKHLRPISLTPILSKVGEEFVVDGYVKPAVLAKIVGLDCGLSYRHEATSEARPWLLLGLGISQGRCTARDQIGALALPGHDKWHQCQWLQPLEVRRWHIDGRDSPQGPTKWNPSCRRRTS